MKRILLPRITASLFSALSLATAHGESLPNPEPQTAQPQYEEPAINLDPAPPKPEKPELVSPRPEKGFHATSSLGDAIDAYKKNPSKENRSAVKFAAAKLNLNIQEQEERLNRTTGADHAKTMVRLEELKKYRAAQLHRMPEGSAIASMPPHRHHLARASQDERGPAEKAKDSALEAKDKMVSGAERVGSKVKAGAKEAALKTKDGAVAIGEKLEDGSKKAGRTIGKGFRKTGEAIERASEPE